MAGECHLIGRTSWQRCNGRMKRRRHTAAVFEAFLDCSWWDVQLKKAYAEPKRHLVQRIGLGHPEVLVHERLVRLKSRKAMPLDCVLMRAGVHVCAFAFHKNSQHKAWYDARILAVENRQHTEERCECRFTIKLFELGDIWGDAALENSLTVTINNVKILQGPYPLDCVNWHHEQSCYDIDSLKNQTRLLFVDSSSIRNEADGSAAETGTSTCGASIRSGAEEDRSSEDSDYHYHDSTSEDPSLRTSEGSFCSNSTSKHSTSEDSSGKISEEGLCSSRTSKHSNWSSEEELCTSKHSNWSSEEELCSSSTSEISTSRDPDSVDNNSVSSTSGSTTQTAVSSDRTPQYAMLSSDSSDAITVTHRKRKFVIHCSSSSEADSDLNASLAEFASYLETEIESRAQTRRKEPMKKQKMSKNYKPVKVELTKFVVHCSSSSEADSHLSTSLAESSREPQTRRDTTVKQKDKPSAKVELNAPPDAISETRRMRDFVVHCSSSSEADSNLSTSPAESFSETPHTRRDTTMKQKQILSEKDKPSVKRNLDVPSNLDKPSEKGNLHKLSNKWNLDKLAGQQLDKQMNKWRKQYKSSTGQAHENSELDDEQGYIVSLAAYWKGIDMPAMCNEENAVFQEQKAPRKQGIHVDGICKDDEHELVMDDEIGWMCAKCGLIVIPIEKMAPTLGKSTYRCWKEQNQENEEEATADEAPSPAYNMYAHDLYAHQKRAILFMARNLIDEQRGCILAHAPGAGKTFTCIAFYDMFRRAHPKNCTLLVLAPTPVLQTWKEQFLKFLKLDIFIVEGNMRPEKKETIISAWRKTRGVLIISYTLFVSQTSPSDDQTSMKHRRYLLEDPDLLFLDEGHCLRTKTANVFLRLIKVRTKRRVLLSGTLFQNNFEELFNVFYVVRPDFIKRLDDWEALESGEEVDTGRRLFLRHIGDVFSTKKRKLSEEDRQLVEREARKKLVALTRSFTDHSNGGSLKKKLPRLFDYLIALKLTPLQQKFYQLSKEALKGLQLEVATSSICIHPYLFSRLKFRKAVMEILREVREQGNSLKMNPEAGCKMKFIVDLLLNTQEKVLVFSEHRACRELLGDILFAKCGWRMEKQILKLDGKCNNSQRQEVIRRFNSEEDESRVCLAAFKACSEGIQLTGASRVVFFHSMWNASQMTQALSRAYREGQKRDVYVYRLVADVEDERKKYERSNWKDWIANNIFENDTQHGATTSTAPEVFEDALLKKLKDADTTGGILRVLKNRCSLAELGDTDPQASQS